MAAARRPALPEPVEAAKLHADKSDDSHQDVLLGYSYNLPYTLIRGTQCNT